MIEHLPSKLEALGSAPTVCAGVGELEGKQTHSLSLTWDIWKQHKSRHGFAIIFFNLMSTTYPKLVVLCSCFSFNKTGPTTFFKPVNNVIKISTVFETSQKISILQFALNIKATRITFHVFKWFTAVLFPLPWKEKENKIAYAWLRAKSSEEPKRK